MAPQSPSPDAAGLVLDLEALLNGFENTEFAYLTAGGTWGTYPTGLRDRIANELIFRLWQARGQPDWPEPAVGLISPLIAEGDVLRVAARIPTAGLVPEACSPNLLAIMEVAFMLVEHQVHMAGAAAFVAEWDFAGKARKRSCEEAAVRVLERFGETGSVAGQRFSGLARALAEDGETIFARTVETVAKEEELRWRARLGPATDGSGNGGLIDASPGEVSQWDIPYSSSHAGSLARPCMELLLRKDLAVSSGIQFQASDVLGRLKDPRTTGGMLRALDSFEHGHTGIRTNLIYALGNLKERRCLRHLEEVLSAPDSVMVGAPGGVAYRQPLRTEKCEAVWALGKLGAAAVEAIPALVALTDSRDLDTRLHLAWALGMIGLEQRRRTGGIDSDVVISLMRLLSQGDSSLFEEAASALKHLGLPDFLHTLHLRDSSTLPVLSLKPSSAGLYELSETILYMVSIKKPVVMAVTGDSGTGKTYFCESITDGFCDIGAQEIEYLKRDRIGDRTLDRIVGFRWLRDHVEPRFFDPYPIPEDRDDPEAYFDDFIRTNARKKLIILDGWRDQAYFNRVIEVFYEKGYLDLLVHFRTTFSTRRLNLEEREGSLDRVKLHLPLVEEPGIEDTSFYREGSVLVYHLDNSIPSRLEAAGIREVFNRRKVETWGDQIRLGRFASGRRPLVADACEFEPFEERVESQEVACEAGVANSISLQESTFTRKLNDDLESNPCLLETITAADFTINRIAFHTQGRLAFCGHDGTVGLLIGFNDRALYARPHLSAVSGLAVRGGEIYSVGENGKVMLLSLERKTVRDLGVTDPPAAALAAERDGRLVTGHRDGSVRIWDVEAGRTTVLPIHACAVRSVAVGRGGEIFSGGSDGTVCILSRDLASVRKVVIPGATIAVVAPYVDGRLAVAAARGDAGDDGMNPVGADVLLLHPGTGRCLRLRAGDAVGVTAMSVYFDGRLVVALDSNEPSGLRSQVAVIDPAPDGPGCAVLGEHGVETRDCLSMGPRIISCGSDNHGSHTLRIWGTASYVAAEHGKAQFLPPDMPKPPYYRSLF